MRKHILTAAKLLTAAVWVTLVILLLKHRDAFSAEAIVSYTPENPFAAGCMLILLYGVKSLMIFFPLKVLQFSAGLLFPVPAALLVNFLGIAVSVTVGYCMGRLLGSDAVRKLAEKNKRLSLLLEEQNGGLLLFVLFLRFLIFLPLETVSMYFGAAKAQFGTYFLGSMLGLSFNIIFSTLMAAGLTDLHAPGFYVAAGAYVLLSLGSFALYLHSVRKRKTHSGI